MQVLGAGCVEAVVRLLVLVLALLAAAPAHASSGLDHVASEDVTLLQNVRLAGSGQGAGLHGNRLLITGPSQLTVFDVARPEAPELLGVAPLGAANESEDVPGDGRWAAVSEAQCADAAVAGGCLAVFDVTGAPRRIASLGMQAQSAACVLGCRYLWVSGENAIVDMADPAAPRIVGTFLDRGDDRLQRGCTFSREARPGLVLASCDPIFALSTLPEHDGAPTRPAILALADTADYRSTAGFGGVPHSARWPRGSDRFMLSTTETPFSPQCGGDDLGAFVVWDARAVLEGGRGFRRLGEWRPANGSYVDGRSPYNAVGCSPHFLAHHPTFADGGLVAVATLENGLRFLQVGESGQIDERSYFLGLGGTAAVPLWHPNGRILYLADYARGLDVLEYAGETYVPARPAPATAPPAMPAPTSAPRAFSVLGVIRNRRGRATIAVEAPGAGRVTATPRAKRLRLERVRAVVRQAGLVTLTIGVSGKARRSLNRRRRIAVDVRVSWRPKRGAAVTKRLRVVLRR